MEPKTSRGVRFSPTVVLVLVVLALAVGALVSRNVDGRVPGTLRVGVLAAESPRRIDRAVGPLATWLANSTQRAGEVVAPGTAGVAELATRCDVMLVPEVEAQEIGSGLFLAWVRPIGVVGAREDLVVVAAPGHAASGLCAVPTAGLVPDLEGAACDSIAIAGSPFSDRELLRAFVGGAYDAVLVRASVVADARLAGWFSERPSVIGGHAQGRSWLALVASPALDPSIRRRIQDSALNLDKYRLEPSHMRAAAVLHALAELGIGGFAPVESFPGLRP